MGVEDILSSTGQGLGPPEFVGQVIEVLGGEVLKGQYTDDNGNPKPYVKLTIKDQEGETHEMTTGAAAIVGKVQELLKGEHLPVSVRVTSYPGQYGKPGYDFRPPEETST